MPKLHANHVAMIDSLRRLCKMHGVRASKRDSMASMLLRLNAANVGVTFRDLEWSTEREFVPVFTHDEPHDDNQMHFTFSVKTSEDDNE